MRTLIITVDGGWFNLRPACNRPGPGCWSDRRNAREKRRKPGGHWSHRHHGKLWETGTGDPIRPEGNRFRCALPRPPHATASHDVTISRGKRSWRVRCWIQSVGSDTSRAEQQYRAISLGRSPSGGNRGYCPQGFARQRPVVTNATEVGGRVKRAGRTSRCGSIRLWCHKPASATPSARRPAVGRTAPGDPRKRERARKSPEPCGRWARPDRSVGWAAKKGPR